MTDTTISRTRATHYQEHYSEWSDILGYGEELFASLEREWGMSGDNDEKILERYAKWMERSKYSGNLCFADITFFNQSSSGKVNVVSIAIAPTRDNLLKYRKILQEDYIGSGDTMVPHPVFQAGLPCFKNHQLPRTDEELRKFSRSIDLETGGLLISKFGEPDVYDGPPRKDDENELFAGSFPTYPDLDIDTLRDSVSQKDISKLWQKWIDVFEPHSTSNDLASGLGNRLNWLVAAPVGYRDHDITRKFRPVATVFLGIDDKVDDEGVHDLVRWILLHLYQANLTSMARRHGEQDQRDSEFAVAQHEISRVIRVIQPNSSEVVSLAIKRYLASLFLKPGAKRQHIDITNEIFRAGTDVLIDYLTDCVECAAEIEAVVDLSRMSDEIKRNPKTATEFIKMVKQQVTEFVVVNIDDPNSSDLLNRGLDDPDSGWRFHRTVVAAMRNVFQHTILQHGWCEDVDPHISLVLCSSSAGKPILLIQNFDLLTRADIASRNEEVSRVSSGGTYLSLMNLVRSYGGDPREVQIICRPQSDQLGEFTHRVAAQWRTEIPLPPVRRQQ